MKTAAPSGLRGELKACLCDVFGTVVDWRSGIVAQCERFARAKGLDADWAAFTDAWRGRYWPFMDQVRSGKLPWTNLDGLHRQSLEEVLAEFRISDLSEAEKAQVTRFWHFLPPWPDAVPGLYRLKSRFIVAAVSNGNVALITDLAKHAGLPWDCILGAELARHYKPDPECYLTAVELLGLEPGQALMVAAHPDDLRAAAAVGLRTAFIPRPAEHGGTGAPPPPEGAWDLEAADFVDLAARLGN